MGLITYNRIYVCIDASPCPVIVDLVIIGPSDHRITMRHDLPPRHRGSRHLHAPARCAPLAVALPLGDRRHCPRVAPRRQAAPLWVPPLYGLAAGAALAAWPPASAAPYGQVAGEGREENRRGRLKLQPINHESPLLFIEGHEKS
ncbi:hypothetical protein GW17_00058512 [Ensete ventricosum]|nr:hypothetical protein GW17_00058512 [Ensete ventricosum]